MLISHVCETVDKWCTSPKVKEAFIRVLFRDYFTTRSEEVNFSLQDLLDNMSDPDPSAVAEAIDLYVHVTTPNTTFHAPKQFCRFILAMAYRRGIKIKNSRFTSEQIREIVKCLSRFPPLEEEKPQLSPEDIERLKKRLYS